MRGDYYIRSFEVKFIDKKNYHDEYHKTTFRVKPFCSLIENVLITIIDRVEDAIGKYKGKSFVVIKTNKGEFIYAFNGRAYQ